MRAAEKRMGAEEKEERVKLVEQKASEHPGRKLSPRDPGKGFWLF